MSNYKKITSKIFTDASLITQTNNWKKSGKKIVFTNGCFDILHRGHISILSQTADLGDKLIIGLNSDTSIKKLKGNNRPILDEMSRAMLLGSLSFVDAVILFSEKTPLQLIKNISPDILAKGGDYKINEIVGSDIVKKNGGDVVLVPFINGFSSTQIINKIKSS